MDNVGSSAASSISTDTPDLKTLLAAGTALLQPPTPLPAAPAELTDRLRAASALLPPAWRGTHGWSDDDELDEVASETADARKAQRDRLVRVVGRRCLALVEGMQAWLALEFWPAAQRDGLQAKDFLLGTADLRLIRLLLSHSVASYLLPLATAYATTLTSRSVATPTSAELRSAVVRLLAFVQTPLAPAAGPSSQPAAPIPPTMITQTVLAAHLPPVLLSAFVLAWTPTAAPATHASLRADAVGALAALPPTQAVWALGGALRLAQAGRTSRQPRGWARPWPAYVEPAASALLSAQLRRPGGVRALMDNVLGEAAATGLAQQAGEAADTQKLEHIAAVLSRPPKGADAAAHARDMLGSLAPFLDAASPRMYTHAACWTVHHLWLAQPGVVGDWVANRLHRPFTPQIDELQPDTVVLSSDAVEDCLNVLVLLATYAPPAPKFTDFLVAPLLVTVFDLYATVTEPTQGQGSIRAKAKQAADEHVAEQVKTLLIGWGKVVDVDTGIKGVWTIIDASQGGDDNGRLYWRRREASYELVYGRPEERLAQPIAFTEHDDNDETPHGLLDQFDLRPDPVVLVRLLKDLGSDDLASEIFLRVLGEWRVRAGNDVDPIRSLVFLRLSLALMEGLGDNVVRKPQQVLLFVEGVLGDAAQEQPAAAPLVQVVEDETDASADADTEDVGKMGLVETAISLLLSVLEGNDELNQTNTTILHPIGTHLDALASTASSARIKHLASEAQLVLLVRRSAAITPASSTAAAPDVPPVLSTYRRALALVADPILPVRAHGLTLLSALPEAADYDAALTPAVLDVLAQALADGESYIYLHAARALARLVETLGKDVLVKLVGMYVDWSRQGKYDVAVRAGEALDMVVRRAGPSLGAHAQHVVPRLAAIFPDAALETVMRTSALSLLGTIAEVAPLALAPWSADLFAAAVDLVQVETVADSPFRPALAAAAPRKVALIEDDDDAVPDHAPRVVDPEPTSKADSKHPALRRAALVFLGVLVAGLIEAEDSDAPTQTDDFVLRLPGQSDGRPRARTAETLPPSMVERARAVLSHVARTDKDEVARAQAAEVGALAGRLAAVRRVADVRAGLLL